MSTPILYAAAAVFLVALGFLLGRRSARSSGVDLVPASSDRPSGSGVLSADVAALMAAGKKIQAIKLYREQTGVGLKEAKDAVESFVPVAFVPAFVPVAGRPAASSVDFAAQASALKQQGQLIQAIKLVREATGWGLREAKDYVERLPS